MPAWFDLTNFALGAFSLLAFEVVVFVIAGCILAKEYDRKTQQMFEARDKNISAEDAAREVS